MNRLPAFLLPLVLALPALAQDAGAAAERQRIQAERARAESVFAAEEKICWGKFAVNDCIDAAKSRRREALADLRRQEISLNDADRKRKAAERLREIEERKAQQPAPPVQPKQQPVAEPRVQAPRPRDPEPAERKAATPPQPDTRENLRRHQARLEEAQEHKGKVERRAAERKKAPRPLPVPP